MCDGYASNELPTAASHQHKDKANIPDCTTTAQSHGHSLTKGQTLIPFWILPLTEPGRAEALSFFEGISIKHLNAYSPSESWRKTLMFCSRTEPSVHHAAIALALVHRDCLDPKSIGHSAHHRRDAPLAHYNRAIQLVLNQEAGNTSDTTAITLLVCYLLTCFDQLSGNYVQAMGHLHGGAEIVRSIGSDKHKSPGPCPPLIGQITRQIRRLDMQAVTFLVDWTPVDIPETPDTFASQRPVPPPLSDHPLAFQSLDHAADQLQILVAKVMKLCNAKQQQTPQPGKDILLEQVETWSGLFDAMLQQGRRGSPAAESGNSDSFDNACRRLRLQHTISWICLSCCGPGREMEYDQFLPQFQQCVLLAQDIAAAQQLYSGSLSLTFTPEVGLVPALYIIGVKCRHPVIRREALAVLRRQSIREAVWDSISAARVVERVIEIEESGCSFMHEEDAVRNMKQIDVAQRIEDLSWLEHARGEATARVDIRYTLSTQDRTYTESLKVHS